MKVKAKKHLGQHFLINEEISANIANSINSENLDRLIEIGPGTGMLTKYLYPVWQQKLVCYELDKQSVDYLALQPWAVGLQVYFADFLKQNINKEFADCKLAIIGNFPYNISTEIAFKVIESNGLVKEFGGMFQKEVAERLCAKHGNKSYGITSVLLQAYYNCQYLFTVDKMEFNPPPKVQSGVIHCELKPVAPDCNYKTLRTLVKTAFGQRRKTLSNALKPLMNSGFNLPVELAGLRAEQLSVETFVNLARNWDIAKA